MLKYSLFALQMHKHHTLCKPEELDLFLFLKILSVIERLKSITASLNSIFTVAGPSWIIPEENLCQHISGHILMLCLISVGKELEGKTQSSITYSAYPTSSPYVRVVNAVLCWRHCE